MVFQLKDNKDSYIKFRVTKEEKDIIKKYCDSANIDVSKYIYTLIHNDLKNKNIIK